MIKSCEICGKEFYVIPSRKNIIKYCSRKCYGISRKKFRASPKTEFKKGQIPWNWKGNKASRNRGNRRARELYPNIQPCKLCGEIKDSRHMVLHHKDNNTLNNKEENVEWMCLSCHTYFHNLQRKELRDKKK